MRHLAITFLVVLGAGFSTAQTPTQDDPIQLFDQLWTIFNEQYAGFEPRNIDWEKVKDQYASMVKPTTSSEELFKICCSMLMELNDAHVSLVRDKENKSGYCNGFGFPDSTSIYKRFKEPEAFYKMVDSTLMLNGFSKPIKIGEHVQYATNENIGYIRIGTMIQSYKGFESALSQAKANESEGIILDLRLNRGGTDYFLHKIAGHFTDKKFIGHYKSTRKKGTDTYSKLNAWKVSPSSGFIYQSPVIILTSDFTVSAAEVFTMTMKELPHVTIVGQRTNGSMSHLSGFKLDNNWSGSLSHKRTFSKNMTNYEGVGVAPDIEVMNSDKDDENFIDRVLLEALSQLKKNQ